ncbi:MAG: hypothetical protein M1379_07925 [Firmicutes bacterium]|nr:hypothetical protein [Bacillota bacterium]
MPKVKMTARVTVIAIICVAFLAVGLVVLNRPATGEQGAKVALSEASAQCMPCHGQKGFSTTVNGKTVSLEIDEKGYLGSVHGGNDCTTCHQGITGFPHTKVVYGKDLSKEVAGSCQMCHSNIADKYKDSVHGRMAAKGKAAPYCADCHGKHDIRRKTDPASKIAPENMSATCGKCHTGSVMAGYNYSFHGTACQLGYENAPSCADCHTAHSILEPENPLSTVALQNQPKTCARCHANAEVNFAKGKKHAVPQDRKNALALYIVWKLFIVLILLDLFKDGFIIILELVQRLRETRAPAVTTHKEGSVQK